MGSPAVPKTKAARRVDEAELLKSPLERETPMFKLIIGTLLAISLIGCNTMRGVGQDIEKGGEKIQDASEKAKQKMQNDQSAR
jgi:entericidin B